MSEHDFMVELFKSIPKAVILVCQFLPKNYVRVTFKDEAARDLALIKGVSVRGFQLNVFEADPTAALVYCYWVPVEVSTDSVTLCLRMARSLSASAKCTPPFKISSLVFVLCVSS